MKGSPSAVGRELRKRAATLKVASRQAEIVSVKRGVQIAKGFSQGRKTRAQLRREGNPYRIGASPPANPGIINYQGGGLYRGWRGRTGGWQGGSCKSRLFNVSPEAQFFLMDRDGKRMIARNIGALVRARLKLERMTRLRQAARKALGLR